ncbi:MAG: PAS domain S-box protein [Chryseotalea sp.]|jgi:PAS domain S-box-containing protein|nr:PAS domain S-box protein [Flammeovirgaceae bacterium]
MLELFRSLPVVIYEYVIEPGGTRYFSFVSETSSTILGIQPEALLADVTLFDSLFTTEDLIKLRESATESHAKGGDWFWSGPATIKQQLRWLEIRSNHHVTPDGQIVRRGIIEDITERLQHRVESESKYQTLIEKLPVGIVIHAGGKLVFANAQAYTSLGAKHPKELLGSDVLRFVHPDFHQLAAERMALVAKGETLPMVEQKFLRMNGTEMFVETIATPVIYKGNPATQVIFRDITDKKHAELQMRKNEMLFTQLFESAPMAVVMLDERGRVHLVNNGFTEMFGFDKETLQGRNLNDFIVPEDLKNEGIDLNNLITSHRVVSIETIRKHKTGRLINVILYGVPVTLENQTIGIYGVYVDITDRKSVEEELKTRNTELDNFVYKVSHDLRAPLSSILGLVNLARLPGNTDNPMDYINLIGEKVDRLDHFISDVLSHSKNLKLDVAVAKVDLREVIAHTFSDLSYLHGASEIKQNVSIEGIDFYNDPWRVAEILRNLISNSIKYRNLDHRIQSEINIKIRIDHLRADISFTDNGIGIDPDSLDRIFEMFFRASEQSDGSGIGLYIVKNAVDKLGGQISVQSKVGIGTRFHIILPNRINSAMIKMPHYQRN